MNTTRPHPSQGLCLALAMGLCLALGQTACSPPTEASKPKTTKDDGKANDGKAADAKTADAKTTDAKTTKTADAKAAKTAAAKTTDALPPAPVPFSFELSARKVEGFDGLHSGAGAMHDGLIVLMAGRRNGLHAFPPERKATKIQAFPRSEANETIYVIDPASATLRGKATIAGLPEAYQRQLRATNTQYTTRDGWLYVVGGYTYDGKSMKTLDTVTAIDLGALVEAVTGSQPLDAAFAKAHMGQASHLALAITGGELLTLGDDFLLIFGNQFDGLYTPGESVGVQTYSQSVRKLAFTLGVAGGAPTLAVAFEGSDPAVGVQQDPEGPYHRRDGAIEAAIDTAGNQRIAAYGGVFKGGRMEGYTTPIYIDADDSQPLGFAIHEDTSATQLLSQYKCAIIQAYDAAGSIMYTNFFGGISQYYWDPATRTLERDAVDLGKGIDGLPFIDSVSTLRLAKAGQGTQTAQYLHEGVSFPPAGGKPQCSDGEALLDAGLLGAETVFFEAPGVPAYDNGVLRLDQLSAPTVVGYFVGGIAATAPYGINGPTCASSLVYTVTLDPKVAAKTTKLVAPPPN